jgi:hypothetical protein
MKKRCLLPMLILLSLTSCKLGIFNKQIINVNKILLLTLEINNSCLTKEDQTKYPDIDFTGDIFLSSFISNYNTTDTRIDFINSDTTAMEKVIGDKQNDILTKYLYKPELMYFPANFNAKNLLPEDKTRLTRENNADAYCIITLNASVWGQSLIGEITVYSTNHKKIWSQDVELISTYIIKDEKSPYITEYDKLFDQLQYGSSHRQEINTVFKELGRELSDQLHKSLKRYLIAKRIIPRERKPRENIIKNFFKKLAEENKRKKAARKANKKK